MIKAIICDVFGVLYVDSISMLKDLVPSDRHIELEDIREASDYGYIDRSEYLQQLSDLTGKSIDELDAMTGAEAIRNEDLLRALIDYKKTYKTALLSNVGHGLFDKLFTDQECETYFDAVVLSSEVHMMKPDAHIFLLTAERLGVRPEECVMIDDSFSNVEAAKQVGMTGIVYVSNVQTLGELERGLRA